MSEREYAAHSGLSRGGVQKARKNGRPAAMMAAQIMAEVERQSDGTIDVTKADAMWGASTDPAKQRGARARDPGHGTAPAKRALAGSNTVP